MNCQVCGKPSGFFPLCKECNSLKDKGKVTKCEDCGKWYIKNEGCKCHASKKENKLPTPCISQTASNLEENACILCKNPTNNGFLFCKDCYYKYKNKTLLLKITNCTEIEMLDESYEGIYTCKDGHIVKSKSEREIDNFLFDRNIKHVYEKTVYTDNTLQHFIKPDFYLNEQDVYLEHWGYNDDNIKYTQQKEYKLNFYRSAKMTVICTYEKSDAKDIESVLEFKIKNFKKGEINFEE